MLLNILNTAGLVSLGMLITKIFQHSKDFKKDLYDKRRDLFFKVVAILEHWDSKTNDRKTLNEIIKELNKLYIEANFIFSKTSIEFLKNLKEKTCDQLLAEDNKDRDRSRIWVAKNAIHIDTLIGYFPDLKLSGSFYTYLY